MPGEFQAIVVKESDTVCTALKNLLKLSVMLWKMMKFKYTIHGTLTPAYKAMICDGIDCPEAADENSSSENPPT